MHHSINPDYKRDRADGLRTAELLEAVGKKRCSDPADPEFWALVPKPPPNSAKIMGLRQLLPAIRAHQIDKLIIATNSSVPN